jgi:hypothetical protein
LHRSQPRSDHDPLFLLAIVSLGLSMGVPPLAAPAAIMTALDRAVQRF